MYHFQDLNLQFSHEQLLLVVKTVFARILPSRTSHCAFYNNVTNKHAKTHENRKKSDQQTRKQHRNKNGGNFKNEWI